MSLIDFEQERRSNPVDVIEQIAALHDWTFERAADDEITISISGGWCEYHVSFSWMEDKEAVHLACAFDLKVPAQRQLEVVRLLSGVNEQLWIGHFDLTTSLGTPGEFWNAEHTAAVHRVFDACRSHRKAVGTMANDAADGLLLAEKGFTAFAFNDAMLFSAALRGSIEELSV